MRQYKATYQDKRGTEDIIIKSNGSELYTTIRDFDFYGGDFDQLTTDIIDTEKFDYELFANGSGDLINFKLILTIPIQLYNAQSNQTFIENLIVNIVVGEHTTIDGLDHEIHCLTLDSSFGKFIVEKKLEWMEDALTALQGQLPPNIYLKTCLSCKFSNYSPFGKGMFGSIYCFQKIKEKLQTLNDKTDLLDIWTKEAMEKGDIFSVQETFDCKEHKLITDNDWAYKSWTKTFRILI